jgi:hypothetical protein
MPLASYPCSVVSQAAITAARITEDRPDSVAASSLTHAWHTRAHCSRWSQREKKTAMTFVLMEIISRPVIVDFIFPTSLACTKHPKISRRRFWYNLGP